MGIHGFLVTTVSTKDVVSQQVYNLGDAFYREYLPFKWVWRKFPNMVMPSDGKNCTLVG